MQNLQVPIRSENHRDYHGISNTTNGQRKTPQKLPTNKIRPRPVSPPHACLELNGVASPRLANQKMVLCGLGGLELLEERVARFEPEGLIAHEIF